MGWGAEATPQFSCSSETGRERCGLPGRHLVEITDVVGWVVLSVGSHALVLPFHQPVRLRDMKFFFVGTIRVIGVAGIAIADHKRLEVIRQLSSQRLLIRSPDLVDDMTKILGDKVVAIGMDLVRGIANLYGRAWVAAPSITGNQG